MGFCDNFSDRCWTACNVLAEEDGTSNNQFGVQTENGWHGVEQWMRIFVFLFWKEKSFALSSSLLFHVNTLDWSNFQQFFFNISSCIWNPFNLNHSAKEEEKESEITKRVKKCVDTQSRKCKWHIEWEDNGNWNEEWNRSTRHQWLPHTLRLNYIFSMRHRS